MAVFSGEKWFRVDMSNLGFPAMRAGTVDFGGDDFIRFTTGVNGADRDLMHGQFVFDAALRLAGGQMDNFEAWLSGYKHYEISGFTISAVQFASNPQGSLATILAGNDTVTGSPFDDLLMGFEGNDLIKGLGGFDTIDGGGGDDTITTGSTPLEQHVLRGGAGNDQLTGGAYFDDLNGNVGNDTLHGLDGDDWVVGGQDHDLLFGENGADIVYGNLGNDTADGGAGADIVRGGQGDDSLSGGGGNDYVSGDRGSDTVSGGSGADIFHTFAGAGVDRVLDFNYAEGDRVLFDRLLQTQVFGVTQSGGDVVITITEGSIVTTAMTLAGVSLASLPSDWIAFTA